MTVYLLEEKFQEMLKGDNSVYPSLADLYPSLMLLLSVSCP